eukprot:scaffold1182_cov396-Prasinococcus_capsulatus_cf.AAC.14
MRVLVCNADGDEVYVLREGYDKRVSVWWQVVPYCGIALSEIFTSVSGLEFAYSQAPASMKSLVMSLYLCTTAVGSVIGIAVSPLMVPANFAVMFFVMGGVMLGVAAVFWVLASRRTPGKVGGGNTDRVLIVRLMGPLSAAAGDAGGQQTVAQAVHRDGLVVESIV